MEVSQWAEIAQSKQDVLTKTLYFKLENEGMLEGDMILASGAQLYATHCIACHSLATERHGIGPYLVGVIGRRIGEAGGWPFSSALRSLDGVWTPERLAQFLADPRQFAPGTAMRSSGLIESEARAIADYIAGAGGG